ncbi:hypothetical protein VB738_12625 [Cyanobium gracile UHCC 0139]|uniref:Uncharacterized protein n=1 Tax=Cyanobium gracile UHCC 0139 TaxID=3110308 RepID=A0ABU5RWE2_9CYAN|nr:hypothetical protein [Cyanobium gracile]MEA5392103.1 hypothetical protein [Cyanobium gracile UHCC 0139]
MKRLSLFLAALSLTLMPISALAVPSVGTFKFEDTGIMGCSGAASRRGSKGWEGPLYAAWDYNGTMVLKLNGQMRSIAFTRSDPAKGAPASTPSVYSGREGNYQVDLTFTSKRTGYETFGGNGALRIYSGQPGDSVSIPVYVAQGC